MSNFYTNFKIIYKIEFSARFLEKKLIILEKYK